MSLTKTDLNQIEKIVEKVVDRKLDEKLDVRFEKFEKKFDAKLDEKLSREEFQMALKEIDERFDKQDVKFDKMFNTLDAILFEMKEYRTEQTATSFRIERLENLHKRNSLS